MGEWIDDYVEFKQEVVPQLKGGLDFTNNINCKLFTVEVKHNVAQVINTGGKNALGVVALRTQTNDVAVSHTFINTTSKGETELTFIFTPVPSDLATKYKVPILVLFS